MSTRQERRDLVVAWIMLIVMAGFWAFVAWGISVAIGDLVEFIRLHVLIVGLIR